MTGNANIPISQACSTAGALCTVASTTGYNPGTPVQFSGGIIPFITDDVVYYVLAASATTLWIFPTLEDALNSANVITLGTSTGSPIISSAIGASTGESRHTQSIDELAAHTHDVTIQQQYYSNQGGGDMFRDGGTYDQVVSSPTGTTDPRGSSTPFNVIQPSTLVNVYLKL